MRAYKNYFEDSYTLNSNIVLRRSFLKSSIYNIETDFSSNISFALYSILNCFLHNATNLTEISSYFRSKGMSFEYDQVQDIINERVDFANLLIASDTPFKVSNPYKNFNKDNHYEHTPENVDLLITNKCNLHCPHCYRNSTAKDLIKSIQLNRFYTVVDEMEHMRVRSLKITGGEAFLVKELFDIIKYTSQKRIHISILTNATIPLSKEWLDILAKPNVKLGVSLDGAKSSTNDQIRGIGSFDKTCSNLLKMKNKNIKFNITFTINKHNYFELKEVVELAYNIGAQSIMFNFIEESGRALEHEDLYDNSKFDKDLIKQQITNLKQSENRIRIITVDNHGLVTEMDDLQIMKEKKDMVICKAGFGSIAIDSSLRVAPCIYGIGGKKEYIIDSLQEKSINDVWNNNKFNLFRGGIRVNDLPKCKKCKNKDICNLKYCRLRPVYDGNSLYDTVSFCESELLV